MEMVVKGFGLEDFAVWGFFRRWLLFVGGGGSEDGDGDGDGDEKCQNED